MKQVGSVISSGKLLLRLCMFVVAPRQWIYWFPIYSIHSHMLNNFKNLTLSPLIHKFIRLGLVFGNNITLFKVEGEKVNEDCILWLFRCRLPLGEGELALTTYRRQSQSQTEVSLPLVLQVRIQSSAQKWEIWKWRWCRCFWRWHRYSNERSEGRNDLAVDTNDAVDDIVDGLITFGPNFWTDNPRSDIFRPQSTDKSGL